MNPTKVLPGPTHFGDGEWFVRECMNLNGTRRRRAFYDGSTTKSVANVQNSHESTIQRLIPALLVLYQPQPTSAFWGKPHVQPLVASATPAGRPIAHASAAAAHARAPASRDSRAE